MTDLAPPSSRSPAPPHSTAEPEEKALDWLVLIYRLPPKSASHRGASVRRKLTAVGAVCLFPASAVAPGSGAAERAMCQIRAMISDAGGTATLLAGCALDGKPTLTSAFNAVYDPEYQVIIDGCRKAMADLQALTACSEFRYQHLWSHDITLRRLSARYRAVRRRDLFGADLAQGAASALVGLRLAIYDYAELVREAGAGPGSAAPPISRGTRLATGGHDAPEGPQAARFDGRRSVPGGQ